MNDKGHAYVLQIDGPLLVRQRELLLNVCDAVLHGVPYVAATAKDQDLLEGITALLDEIGDQAHDRHGIASLVEPDVEQPDGPGPDNENHCECEKPGHFCSGIPGILAHVENGRLLEGAKVERCDLCGRYPSDATALDRLRDLGLAAP